MRKHIVIFLIAICCACSFQGRAQHWLPVKDGITQGSGILDFDVDTVNNILYMAGMFKEADSSVYSPGVLGFDGTNYFALGCGIEWNCVTPISGPGPSVNTVCMYNGEVYAGGSFSMAGNIPCNNIARWNGTTWDSLGSGINGVVWGMREINGELYVVGGFSNAGGIPVNSIAKWNGTGWSDVHSMPNFGSGNAFNDVIEFNNELYVCGNFQGANGCHEIVKWDGTAWTNVGGGFYGANAGVEQMCMFQGKLYVSGAFTRVESASNPSDNIALWDGTTWSDPAGGTFNPPNPFVNGQIHDMVVFHNELWICGAFQCAGGVSGEDVAKWDGIQWCTFDTIGTFDSRPYALAVFNDSLYLGGGFDYISGNVAPSIVKWEGGNWVDSCGQYYLGIEEPLNIQQVLVYPNPAADNLIFQFSEAQTTRTIVVLDAQGREIWRKETSESMVTLSTSEYSNGMYFYSVLVNDFHSSSGKFVVSH